MRVGSYLTFVDFPMIWLPRQQYLWVSVLHWLLGGHLWAWMSSTGFGVVDEMGVVLHANIARWGSSFASFAFCKIALPIFT